MMQKNVLVAPVGDHADNIFIGIRDFPTERLILLATQDKQSVAEKIKRDVERFKIGVQIVRLKGNLWESLFEIIARIKQAERGREIIINTSSADRNSQCALTSAAFVNGVKAFAVEHNETMLLPILKFSYYKILTERKMNILSLLYQDRTCCGSLEELSRKTKMSLPLISYHINGTLKSEGLKNLGLVEVSERKGRTTVQLSTMGELLVKGYVKSS